MPSSSANEREPLLRHEDSDSIDHQSGQLPPFRLSKLARYCLLLSFLLELSNNVLAVPLISLFERAICEAYFRKNAQDTLSLSLPIDEVSCKLPPIQSELAKLRGWKGFFETLSGTPLTRPSVAQIWTHLTHKSLIGGFSSWSHS